MPDAEKGGQAPFILYLHGFNSSPASVKARQLQAFMQAHGLGAALACPALPVDPGAALECIDQVMREQGPRRYCFVGSSLGGFYATCMAERHAARAVLINPSITPHVTLRACLGPQTNLYTGERYVLTAEHVAQWERMWLPDIHSERYFLLVETGDAQLDYRQAVARYAGALQRVIPGGDHSLQSFPEHIPALLEFAGLGLQGGS